MKAYIVLLIALFAFVAVSEARPIAYSAVLTAANVGQTGADIGVAHAIVADRKGGRQRVRIFGMYSNTAGAAVDSVWLTSPTGQKWIQVPHANSTTLNGGRHFYINTFLNNTHRPSLLSNTLTIAIFAANTSFIGGPLTSAPRVGVAHLLGANVVPAVSNSFQGLGFFSIAEPTPVSSDLNDLYNSFYSSLTVQSAIVHDVTSAASGAIFGNAFPGNNSQDAALATLTGGSQYYYQPPTVTTNADYYGVDFAANYFLVSDASAAVIRGNTYPASKVTRSLNCLRYSVQFGTITGDITVKRLKKFNNAEGGNTVKPGSSLVLATGDSNIFVGVFVFRSPVGRKVNETLRGLDLETGFLSNTADLWEVSVLNTIDNTYLVWGTHSKTGLFTKGEAHWNTNPGQFVNNLNEIYVRITVAASSAATLTVDQLALRGYIPNARSAKIAKNLAKTVASQYTYTL